mgnify:CR=1 FL=1
MLSARLIFDGIKVPHFLVIKPIFKFESVITGYYPNSLLALLLPLILWTFLGSKNRLALDGALV